MIHIGRRWLLGAEPPVALSHDARVAIRQVEADVAALGADTSSWRWTLTWLESRPRLELDDGTLIQVHADGTVTVSEPVDD